MLRDMLSTTSPPAARDSKAKAKRGTSRQTSRAGTTRELLHCCLQVAQPQERWTISREPGINPAFALAEVVWILMGRKDSAFLNFWNPALRRFASKGPAYYGAYGERLRFRFGIDQLRAAYEALAARPDSRQVVLQIWDPAGDLPMRAGRPREEDIPCNLCSLLKVRRGRLEWVQVMRSNDLILGLPHNFVQFTMLQELMASWLGVRIGPYIHYSYSLHVYERQLGDLRRVGARRVPPNRDTWSLPYRRTMKVFAELSDRMDGLRQPSLTEKGVGKLCELRTLPPQAANILAIVGADAARRHGHEALAEHLARMCSNPPLRTTWARWRARQEDRHVREHRSHAGTGR